MASLIPGYNYDIFISYRQKDNKGDRWVSAFVEALKTELEATFKEEINVYFDANSDDGLLETHDVDDSLKDKLKCLVFIPIISRTYCDPKSFAWEHEFRAFVEQASKDQFGLKAKLPNGNVASRVLPVLIHDLDNSDINEYEKVVGGVLRGIEFIYKEPGVNRPLAPEDDQKTNTNKTRYRNQINKAALAIKEIISGLKKEPGDSFHEEKEILFTEDKTAAQKKSIIVLPFENISSDRENEYFCDGITEEIINALTRVEGLHVLARTSAFALKGKNMDVREIGQKFNVDTLLEGSVRKSGSRIRITAQLINIRNGYHLWSENYDRELIDIFELQDEISMQIVNKLKISIKSREEEMLVRRCTDNLEAYNLYLKGRFFWNRLTDESLRKGLDYFRQAILLDPDYALAFSGIADTYCRLAWYSYSSPEDSFPRAKEAAIKALELDDRLPEAYSSLGFVSMCFDRNYDQAFRQIKHALQLNPGFAGARTYYSICLAITGRHEESIEEGKRALELDPLTPMAWINLGGRYYYARQYELCVANVKKSLEIDPEFAMTHYYLAYFYSQMKLHHEALSEIQQVFRAFGRHNTQFLAAQAIIQACSGDLEGAEAVVNEIMSLSKTKYASSFWLATIYVTLGQTDKAFEYFEKAFQSCEVLMIFLNVDPVFDPVRTDPRFRALLAKMNFIR